MDGGRLRQARELQGLTQEQLATRSGLPQSIISRIELKAYHASDEEIQKLADSLEIPKAFLGLPAIEMPDGSLGLFRSYHSKVKKQEYKLSRRRAEIGVEALLRLSQDAHLPACRIRIVESSSPEEAARFARSMLRLPPDEPIGNLTHALERSGVLMLRLSDISEDIIGFSTWLDPINGLMDGERPLIVTRRPLTAFRLRFTLAHELGHIVLGHQVFAGPQKPVERDANIFAQALLMPQDAAEEELGSEHLTIERLAVLKSRWGMSMHALAMRAKFLNIINEAGYRNIYESLRYHGYLKREPGDMTTVSEQPRLLSELLDRNGLTDSVYDLAGALDLGVGHVRSFLSEMGDSDPLKI